MKDCAHAPGGIVFHFFGCGVGAVVGHGSKCLVGRAPARFEVQVRAAGEAGQPGLGQWLAASHALAEGQRLQGLQVSVKRVERVAFCNMFLFNQRRWDIGEGCLDDEHIPVGRTIVDGGGDLTLERSEHRRTREQFAVDLVVANIHAVMSVVFLHPFGVFGVVDEGRGDERLGDIRGDLRQAENGERRADRWQIGNWGRRKRGDGRSRRDG